MPIAARESRQAGESCAVGINGTDVEVAGLNLAIEREAAVGRPRREPAKSCAARDLSEPRPIGVRHVKLEHSGAGRRDEGNSLTIGRPRRGPASICDLRSDSIFQIHDDEVGERKDVGATGGEHDAFPVGRKRGVNSGEATTMRTRAPHQRVARPTTWTGCGTAPRVGTSSSAGWRPAPTVGSRGCRASRPLRPGTRLATTSWWSGTSVGWSPSCS